MVRFSEAELVLVQERAALAGLAVGAWIGQTVLDVAQGGDVMSLGLPDPLRLRADVLLVERAASADGVVDAEVGRLLAQLDAVLDAVVAEFERDRR